jgi:hypothetical protein
MPYENITNPIYSTTRIGSKEMVDTLVTSEIKRHLHSTSADHSGRAV